MALPEHPTPHDATFKEVFSRPDSALALMRAVLPAAVVDAIEPGSLEPENTAVRGAELRERFTDVLLRGRLRDGKDVLVYVLLEHQHEPDPWMPLRILGYLLRIWEDWRQRNPGSDRLPVIIPLILNQGPRPWNVARSLGELYAATPELLHALGCLVPRLDLAVHDLGGRSPADVAALEGPPLAQLALALLRAMADPEVEPADVLEPLRHLVCKLASQTGGTADLKRLILYVVLVKKDLDVRAFSGLMRDMAGPRAGEAVMTGAQQLMEVGVREMLLKQLEQAFGELAPSVRERVAGTTGTELEACVLRVRAARSLDEVFAPPTSSPVEPAPRGKGGAKKRR